MPTQPAVQPNTSTVTQTPAPQTEGATTAGATPASFDEWLTTQDDTIKGLVETRFTALENTVRATRSERDNLAAEIKKLAKTQAEGSDARKALDDMGAKLEQTERRADFMEEALKPEIQCRNPRAAWLLAQAEGHFTKTGRPDWQAIRAAAPELFGAVTGNDHAGAGTQTPPPAQKNMNDFIRKAAGRG